MRYSMGRVELCLSSRIYAIRRRFPAMRELECRMLEVEKELNRDHGKGKSCCDCCRKPMEKCCVKNRQKP